MEIEHKCPYCSSPNLSLAIIGESSDALQRDLVECHFCRKNYRIVYRVVVHVEVKALDGGDEHGVRT